MYLAFLDILGILDSWNFNDNFDLLKFLSSKNYVTKEILAKIYMWDSQINLTGFLSKGLTVRLTKLWPNGVIYAKLSFLSNWKPTGHYEINFVGKKTRNPLEKIDTNMRLKIVLLMKNKWFVMRKNIVKSDSGIQN